VAQLGPSALAGFSLFILVTPLQERIMAGQYKIRRGSVKWTDQRAKLLLEVLSSMRIVKYFTYEQPFLKRKSHLSLLPRALCCLSLVFFSINWTGR
jgi:ATP-binding cassette, subfamily C (CFTR/MRP), member 1